MSMDKARFVVESTLVPHTAFGDAMRRVKQCMSYGLKSPEPICLALVGESRTGKSRLLEECELSMPRYRTGDGAVVPILRLTTPSRPTVKGVAGMMLKALGDPKWYSGTENQLTIRIQDQLRECQTVTVMLDEFQHFFDKGRQKIFHDAADWLKIVIDHTKVALIVSGLETCLPVLSRSEQLSGRFLAPVFMRRFNWLDDADRSEFIAILEAFNGSMSEFFSLPDLHSDEMAFRFWCASGGLMGYLTKFLRQTVWDACDAGERSLTLEGFATAHRSAIWTASNAGLVESPFDRNFSVNPTQEKITLAQTVGVGEVEVDPPRSRRRKNFESTEPLSRILRGSGK
jgi:hypothetical protein